MKLKIDFNESASTFDMELDAAYTPGGGGGGVIYWSSVRDKPFESLDPQTLVVNDGVLAVNTTNDVENGGARPVTAAGVNVVVGNINVLLSQI